MNDFAHWLTATSISLQLQEWQVWLWPLCETLHFVGLSLLIGVAGFFDLRLLGVMKRIPLEAAMAFMPWAIVGFLLNLVTGVIFFVIEPAQYLNSAVWWAKLFFLLLAGLNAMLFQTTMLVRVRAVGPGQDTTIAMKLVGAMSLFAWFAVLYFGRMLPYLGNAY